MKTLELQYLIEAETKLQALQYRLDMEYPNMPCKSLVREYYDCLDYVNRLKKELSL
jgi:hypothetical protein